MRKVSMQTIADRLGVSKYTVSKALSGKPGIGEETRLRVLEMAETLGYRSKPVRAGAQASPLPFAPVPSRRTLPSPGDTLPSGDTPLFADTPILAGKPSLAEPAAPVIAIEVRPEYREEPDFWKRVLEGIGAACREAGFGMRFADDPGGRPETAAGVIVMGSVPRQRLLALNRLKAPVVVIDHDDPLVRADTVWNDNLEAARLACSHLLSQGCRKLAFVGRDRFAVSFKERWWGCKLTADEWKKTRPETGCVLRKWTVPYGSGDFAQHLRRRVIEAGDEGVPDGFVCANDRIAMALAETLEEAGIGVPHPCRIVGIDNIEPSAAARPPLTTVHLAKEQLGARAVHALLRRLAQPHALREKIVLSAELIVRQSG
ncbi:LacI family DNA-binding transcriptional regulator [Cohnella algarum]|uniref:LacI family DNA-binding transcriptional regulator n=1 Tax=Cohnella algarum TaxID=2044859 RepID=UPI001F085B3B|nr:LacI family DNA-binding transcriptional regulator [Cohnella algarum]